MELSDEEVEKKTEEVKTEKKKRTITPEQQQKMKEARQKRKMDIKIHHDAEIPLKPEPIRDSIPEPLKGGVEPLGSTEKEIIPVMKPKRVVSESTKEALKKGREALHQKKKEKQVERLESKLTEVKEKLPKPKKQVQIEERPIQSQPSFKIRFV